MPRVLLMGKETFHARKATIENQPPISVCARTQHTHVCIYGKSDDFCMNYIAPRVHTPSLSLRESPENMEHDYDERSFTTTRARTRQMKRRTRALFLRASLGVISHEFHHIPLTIQNSRLRDNTMVLFPFLSR